MNPNLGLWGLGLGLHRPPPPHKERKDASDSGLHIGRRLQGQTAGAGKTGMSVLVPSMMGLD